MSFRSLLNNTAILSRMAEVTDGVGGVRREWTTVTSTLPCRVVAKSAVERAMSGSQGVAVTHKVFAETGTPILETDRLTVGSAVLEIKSINEPAGHHYEIEAMERRPNRAS